MRDHPRRCGENIFRLRRKTRIPGSPPQVRGKLEQGSYAIRGRGITPAGAGKTPAAAQRAAHAGDHPRRCGENCVVFHFVSPSVGSPPQVRGKRFAICDLFSPFRITPAGAGKTEQERRLGNSDPDHPRRCGENYRRICIVYTNRGSPPQVRGKPAEGTLSGFHKEDHPRRCGENQFCRCPCC